MVTTQPAPVVSGATQRRTVAFLSAAQVLSGVGAGAVVSTGSLLAVDLSGADAWAGSVTTATTLGAAIASALLARLAHDRGRRPALATGLLVATAGALTAVAAGVLRSFPLLILAGALMGFGNAVNLQARFAATDLSTPDRRARDLSLVGWMSTVGAIAGPNLMGPSATLATAIGLPELTGMFVLSAAGMVAGMLVLWVGLRPDPYLASRQASPTGNEPAPDRPGFLQGARVLLSYPNARTALVGMLAAHAVMVAVMSMTPVHLTGHGATITIVGMTVSLHIAGMYALAPVMGVLTDRLGARPMMATGLGAVAASTLIAGFSGASYPLTMVGLVLLGLGWSAATVAGSALLVDAVPGPVRVASQGVSDSLMSLAGGLGGALAGVALATVGYAGLGIAATITAVAALAATMPLRSLFASTRSQGDPS
jgi:MFS family permease